jgi:hypothetical protein
LYNDKAKREKIEMLKKVSYFKSNSEGNEELSKYEMKFFDEIQFQMREEYFEKGTEIIT